MTEVNLEDQRFHCFLKIEEQIFSSNSLHKEFYFFYKNSGFFFDSAIFNDIGFSIINPLIFLNEQIKLYLPKGGVEITARSIFFIFVLASDIEENTFLILYLFLASSLTLELFSTIPTSSKFSDALIAWK